MYVHDIVVDCIVSSDCKKSILDLECLKNIEYKVCQCSFSMWSIHMFKSQQDLIVVSVIVDVVGCNC